MLALLLVSAAIAVVCAYLNAAGSQEVAGATSHVLIDDPGTSVVDRAAAPQDVETLQNRAELYARLMTTPPVLEAIAHRAGLPPGQLSGVADLNGNLPVQYSEAPSEEHASQLESSKATYRLELQADPDQPVLNIYALAPSVSQADRLADDAISGLRDYLSGVANRQGIGRADMPVLRELGPARGGVTNSGARIIIAGLTFITVFALAWTLLFCLVRRPWRRRTEQPAPRPSRSRLRGRAAADWPRTTRLLPWSVAVLIAMIWLTPFDRIQLAMSAPVNISLDRIVLPIVVAIWLLAVRSGPGARPRLRFTPVHAAVAAFLACAFASTVVDAHYLNHVEELTLSLKKLPLLVSYMSVFLIVASSVRRTEVRAFLNFTLVLAVIVAVGTIYEYRSGPNLFNTISFAVFRSPLFKIGDTTSAALLDSDGRNWVVGPSAYGVELVAMLSTALPIAVLGLLRARTRWRYLLYGLVILVLLYAMVATDRKSALIAPAAAFITVAYLRRRELISLAPLVLVIVIVLAVTSPTVVREVVGQYTSAHATQTPTVDSRVSNYDAIRPDLWSHLLLGRGQGTYAPPTDRIIDSEVTLRLVETGALGLIAFLLIPVSLIAVTRRVAAGRDLQASTAAACGVVAGVVFIVVSTLYSVMSMPHAPDVFLYVAGLAVVAVGAPDAIARPPSPHPGREREHPLQPRRRQFAERERALPVHSS